MFESATLLIRIILSYYSCYCALRDESPRIAQHVVSLKLFRMMTYFLLVMSLCVRSLSWLGLGKCRSVRRYLTATLQTTCSFTQKRDKF